MKKLTLLLIAILSLFSVSAQETVKLTVSGQGATKEEATANALRSAIEQAYGVFVSANTQILNDEVVKDEIATIASGNIQEYKELGYGTMPNGQQFVSLSATVSIGNLISYAKSKGSSAEFAGGIFGMNLKMRQINKDNENVAIVHLLEQLKAISCDMFRVEIDNLGVPAKIDWNNYNYLYSNKFKEAYPYSQSYFIDFRLKYYTTAAYKQFNELLFNSLQSISLNANEVKAYKESGEPLYALSCTTDGDVLLFREKKTDGDYNASAYYFRNNIVGEILDSIYKIILDAQMSNWQIVRKQLNGSESPIDFETIDGLGSRTYSFHNYWESVPSTRFVEWVKPSTHSFPFAKSYGDQYGGYDQSVGYGVQIINFQKMELGSNEVATRNIKIAFSEEELNNTTEFEIKHRENIKHNNILQIYELLYTNDSSTEPAELGEKIKQDIISHIYDNNRKCWVLKFTSGKFVDILGSLNSNRNNITSISLPNGVTSIGYREFCYWTSLRSITIPNSVTSIGDQAFVNCASLTNITIPDSVTLIGPEAFDSCTSLRSITIPDSVTSIGYNAFSNCRSLTSVTIGNGVESLGSRAFDYCSSLTEVYCKPTTPPLGNVRMFYGSASGLKIYVPRNSVDAYKLASGWSDYASSIVGYDF